MDDFASMREVVTRRFRRLRDEDEVFPDILLIDGGKGQLNAAAQERSRRWASTRRAFISLAKQEEEIFWPGESESIKLSKHSAAAAIASVRAGQKRTGSPSTATTVLRRKRLTDD